MLQYSLPDCYARIVTFFDFLQIFEKRTPKNTTKPKNIPGRVSTLVKRVY